MPYDVFVSYKSEDLAKAQAVATALGEQGLKVWFDKARLEPGCDWHAQIEDGCENSRVLMPVLTPRWRESEWTRFETYGAESIIPLLCEGNWDDVITPPLERFQAEKVDATDLSHTNWTRLAQAVRRECEKPAPDRAPRLANLRYRPNDCFVGREKDLVAIHEELHRNPRTVLTQGRVRAIAAMGGVGKTTLARHYAEKFWRCYHQMFWVDCRHLIESEFACIYDLVFPESVNAGLTPPEKAAKALQELSGSCTRLLILDNAEDEKTVQDWIPKSGNCHTLLTSRFAGWSAAIKTMHLYLLDKEPALHLLDGRIGRSRPKSDQPFAEALVEKLGYLPLAIEQAAAFINQQGEGFDCRDYLRLFEAATEELLLVHPLGSTEYPAPLASTWKSTITRLTPGARTILQVMSFLSSAHLPTKLLLDGAAAIKLQSARKTGAHVAAPSNDEFWIRNELACLRGYSMVESDGGSVWVHPLVQVVERLNLTPGEQTDMLELAIACFATHAPIDIHRHQMTKLWRFLLPHAEELGRIAGQHPEVELHPRLLLGLGYIYYDQHRIREAIGLCHQAVRILVREGRATDPDCLRALQKIGNMLDKKGRMNLAERLLRQAVAGLRGVLGNEDPVTLSAVNDLGNVLANRRKSDEAAKCYQECLDIHDRFLKTIGEKKLDEEIARDRDSPEHNRPWQALSGRMTALIGLGSVACDRHNLEEAERLLRSATSDALRLLGPNHPETAAAYDWLSNALFTQRRCREAAEARDRAYQITDAVLGSDHHTTVNNLMMLVIYRFVSGDLAGATASFRRLRETCMKCTRTELIGFAGITGQLATSLASRGLLPEACEYFKIEYEMRLRCHQTRDPATPAALNNLLALTRMLGDEDEVKKLEGEQIALLEEAEGRDAPATISAINDLAKRLESLDAFEEAEVQYRKAIEHAPNAIVVLGNYAFFRQNFRRDMAGARELYLQALRADPDDSINHTNFAGLCLVTNQMAEAESHLRDAWRLTGGKADGYTWRTLFLRAALAALRNESVTLYLGQLRTLVDAGIRPVPSRNLAVRERLRQGLSGAVAVLLDAVYQAITESRGVAGLAERSDWQAIRPVPLDSPWPG